MDPTICALCYKYNNSSFSRQAANESNFHFPLKRGESGGFVNLTGEISKVSDNFSR